MIPPFSLQKGTALLHFVSHPAKVPPEIGIELNHSLYLPFFWKALINPKTGFVQYFEHALFLLLYPCIMEFGTNKTSKLESDFNVH